MGLVCLLSIIYSIFLALIAEIFVFEYEKLIVQSSSCFMGRHEFSVSSSNVVNECMHAAAALKYVLITDLN